jgi:16S rRNA processing protein RimM
VAVAWDDLVLVGRIARTHGHRGAVIVNPDTDFPEERFKAGATVWLLRAGVPEAVVIHDAWFHQGRPVLTLAGVESMNDAEAMRGVELRVPQDALQPLPEGAYYHFQLEGCRVVSAAGDEIGVVTAVEGEAGGQRLVVATPDGEVLVPFATAICTAIDVTTRRIVIDPPAGLLEVNKPGGSSRS